MARRLTKFLVSSLLCAFGFGHGAAGETKGPLAELPSKPGAHIAKIKALGDNEWLHLGSPAADPKWGKARGRSWSSNMPAAPDLRGMFVFAEGVHGFVKPDGHYMNDLWFYDINAHRWVCLYPGIDVKTIVQRIKDGELTVDDNGLMVDKKGEPLPPLLIHAYGYLGYDPERKKFVTFGGQFANYFTTGKGGVFEEGARLFNEQRKGKKLPDLSPFFYDTATGRFECFAVDRAPKGQPYGANLLVYIGSKKQFLYGGVDNVWYLDQAKRTWTAANPNRVYFHCTGGKKAEENFLIYDVKDNTWARPAPKGPGPFSSTSYESIFNFDTASDELVSIRLYNKDEPGRRRGVYAYDPKTNTWGEPLPIPAEVVKSIRNGNYGCYDPELNVYFCHFAGDSRDDGTMWVYRYKKR
jgi:hypothetical protein